jgi:hypothetical protein
MTLYETIKDKLIDLDKKYRQAGNGSSQAEISAQMSALYWVLAQITIAEAEQSVEVDPCVRH